MKTDDRGPKQSGETSGHEPHAVWEKPAGPTTEEQTTNNDDHTVFEDLAGIVRTSAAVNGVHMWTHVTGEQGSSTRMEIAAAVIALHIKKAIFIGSDSKSMVDKAKWLITKAKEAEAEDYPSTYRPTKKPWQMQKDGDLWRWFWEFLRSRGPD